MPWTAADRPFLDPAVVARLGTLELKARTIVEGFLSGLHRSPFKGFSVEFAEYRQYIPGDDLHTIDWKVYARSDRHYVKKFEEETNLDCHLLLDVSGSMGYGSHHGMTKFEYGACLAASLGYLMNRQRDAVGLTAFAENIVEMLPASSRPGHLRALLVTLDRLVTGQKTDVSKPLHLLADSITKRGLVVLISDLLDNPDDVIRGLKHFQFRGVDVIVFHILDPDELEFPFEHATRFEDVETSEEVMAVPGAVREHDLKAIGGLVDRYRRELGATGIHYQLLNTNHPLELALMSYLSTRSRALRPQGCCVLSAGCRVLGCRVLGCRVPAQHAARSTWHEHSAPSTQHPAPGERDAVVSCTRVSGRGIRSRRSDRAASAQAR